MNTKTVTGIIAKGAAAKGVAVSNWWWS